MSFTNVADRCFIDTNVAVYLLGEDSVKAARAEALLAERPTISTQVVNEFINVCTRKLGLACAAAHETARALMQHCEVVPLDAVTVERVMRLGERYGFSHWDALIVAAATLADCTILFSEDMQDGQTLGGLAVRNPFC